MSLSLGTLEIGLGLNTAQYDSGIKSAKDKLSSLERRVDEISSTVMKIKVGVDDSQLYKLNDHLNIKTSHLEEVVNFYKANPIKVFVDDKSLEILNQKLDNLGKQNINLSSSSGEQIGQQLFDGIEKALSDLGNVVSAPLKSVFTGVFEGIGNEISKIFTRNAINSFTSSMGIPSLGDLGNISGEEIGVSFGGKRKSTKKSTKKKNNKQDNDFLETLIDTGFDIAVDAIPVNNSKLKKLIKTVLQREIDNAVSFAKNETAKTSSNNNVASSVNKASQDIVTAVKRVEDAVRGGNNTLIDPWADTQTKDMWGGEPDIVKRQRKEIDRVLQQKSLPPFPDKSAKITEITPYFDEKVFPVSNSIPTNIKAINPEYYTVKQLRGLARDQGINVPASGVGAKKEEIWKALTERFNPDQLTRLLLTTKASDRTKLGKKELSGFQIPTTEIPADFTKRIGIGIKNIGQEINTTKDIQSLERLYFQLEKVKEGITALRANPEFNTTSINKSLSGFLQSVDNLQTQILAKGGLESGQDLQQGLKLGLSNNSAQKIAYQNALKIVDATDKGLGNASPSKKGKKSGKDYIKGIEIGAEEQSKSLFKKVSDIGKKTAEILTTDITKLGKKKDVPLPNEVQEIVDYFAESKSSEEELYKKRQIHNFSASIPEFKVHQKDKNILSDVLLKEYVNLPLDQDFAANYQKIKTDIDKAQTIKNSQQREEFLQKTLSHLPFYTEEEKQNRKGSIEGSLSLADITQPLDYYENQFPKKAERLREESQANSGYFERIKYYEQEFPEQSSKRLDFSSSAAWTEGRGKARSAEIEYYKQEIKVLLEAINQAEKQIAIQDIEKGQFSIDKTYSRHNQDLDSQDSLGFDLAHREDVINKVVDEMLTNRHWSNKKDKENYDYATIKSYFAVGDDFDEQLGFYSIAEKLASETSKIKDPSKLKKLVTQEMESFPVIERQPFLDIIQGEYAYRKNYDGKDFSEGITNTEADLLADRIRRLKKIVQSMVKKIDEIYLEAGQDYQELLKVGFTETEARDISIGKPVKGAISADVEVITEESFGGKKLGSIPETQKSLEKIIDVYAETVKEAEQKALPPSIASAVNFDAIPSSRIKEVVEVYAETVQPINQKITQPSVSFDSVVKPEKLFKEDTQSQEENIPKTPRLSKASSITQLPKVVPPNNLVTLDAVIQKEIKKASKEPEGIVIDVYAETVKEFEQKALPPATNLSIPNLSEIINKSVIDVQNIPVNSKISNKNLKEKLERIGEIRKNVDRTIKESQELIKSAQSSEQKALPPANKLATEPSFKKSLTVQEYSRSLYSYLGQQVKKAEKSIEQKNAQKNLSSNEPVKVQINQPKETKPSNEPVKVQINQPKETKPSNEPVKVQINQPKETKPSNEPVKIKIVSNSDSGSGQPPKPPKPPTISSQPSPDDDSNKSSGQKVKVKAVSNISKEATQNTSEQIKNETKQTTRTFLERIFGKPGDDFRRRREEVNRRREADPTSVSYWDEFFRKLINKAGSKIYPEGTASERRTVLGEVASTGVAMATAFAPISTAQIATLFPLVLPAIPAIISSLGVFNMLSPAFQGGADRITQTETINSRLNALTGNPNLSGKEYEYLKELADKYRVSLQSLSEGYTQLAIAARGTKLEGDPIKDLFEGITASVKALRLNTADTSLILNAYTQILSKGKVSMEELRQQLGEKFPPAMQVFSKALGVSTAEFNTLISKGAILSEDILEEVGKVLKSDFGSSALAFSNDFTSSLAALETAGFEFSRKFAGTFSPAYAAITNLGANTLRIVSDNFRTILELATALSIGVTAQIAVGLQQMLIVPAIANKLAPVQAAILSTWKTVLTGISPFIVGTFADVLSYALGADQSIFQNITSGIKNAVESGIKAVDAAKVNLTGISFFDPSWSKIGIPDKEVQGLTGMLLKIPKAFGDAGSALVNFFKTIPSGVVELAALALTFEQLSALYKLYLVPMGTGLKATFIELGKAIHQAFLSNNAFLGHLRALFPASGTLAERFVFMRQQILGFATTTSLASASLNVLKAASLAFIGVASKLALPLAFLSFANGDFTNQLIDDFRKFENNAISNIENIQKALDGLTAPKLKVEIDSPTELPSKGIELNPLKTLNLSDKSYKSDDLTKSINRNSVLAGFIKFLNPNLAIKDAKKQAEPLGIGNYFSDNQEFLTQSQTDLLSTAQKYRQFGENLNNSSLGKVGLSDPRNVNKFIDTTRPVVNDLKIIDATIQRLSKQRIALGLENTTDARNEIKKIDDQIGILLKKRKDTAKPLQEVMDFDSIRIGLQEQIKQIDESDYPEQAKRSLKALLQPTLDNLNKVKSEIDKAGISTILEPLESIWQSTIDRLSDAEKTFNKILNKIEIRTSGTQLDLYTKNLDPAAVQESQAKIDINKQKETVKALQTILQERQSALSNLLSIPNVENNDARKQEIDDLREKVTDSEKELASARLSLAKSEYDATQDRLKEQQSETKLRIDSEIARKRIDVIRANPFGGVNTSLRNAEIDVEERIQAIGLLYRQLADNTGNPIEIKSQIVAAELALEQARANLLQQQTSLQDYYRNLDRQIVDFNRQIEDYRRQIEDAQLSAFKENRSLSESYSDLVRELDKNLLNAQNQLLDTTDRIRVQQVKNRLLIPGTSDAGKELGDIFLEFVQGQADIASRGRTFQSRTEEIETSYISTLRNIRNLQEQQQEAERNRLRTIEDIKRTQENLNRTLADLIRQTNRELGFIPQSIKDIVTNLNTLPEPIKLINSELVAIPPNIKTSGEDLVKSIEETAEAIRKAKEGLILPAPSNFIPAPVWNGGGFLPPPPPSLSPSQSSQSQSPSLSPSQSSSMPKGLTRRGQELFQHLDNPHVKAFLDTIAYAEGTANMPNKGYNTLFGHRQFSSLATHPNIHVPFGNTTSTAAGRYQAMNFVWDEEKVKLGLKDFSPVSQDLLALSRILMRGGLDELLKGDIRGAINATSKEWASFPGANYPGQGMKRMEDLVRFYQQSLQKYQPNAPRTQAELDALRYDGNPANSGALNRVQQIRRNQGGPEFSSPPPIAQLPTLPNQNQDNFWDADLPPVLKDNPINFQNPNLPPVPKLSTDNLGTAAGQIRNAETANQEQEDRLRQLESSFLTETTLDRAIKFGRQQEEEARDLNRTIRDASESVTDLTINSKGYLTVQEEINKSATEVSRQYRSQIESLQDQRRNLEYQADGWKQMSENIKKMVAEQTALGQMPADVAEQFLKNADALAKRSQEATEQINQLDQAIEQLGKNQKVATLEASFRKTRDTVRSIRDRMNDLTIQRMKLEDQSRPTLFDDSAILAERINLQKEKEELEDYLQTYEGLPQYAEYVANIRSEWAQLAELRLKRAEIDASPNKGAAGSFFSDIREGKGVGTAFGNLGLNVLTKFVEGITKPAIDALTQAIDGFTKPITQAFESVFNSLIGPVGNFFNNALTNIFKPAGNIFSSAIGGSGGGGLFSGLLGGLTGLFGGGLGSIGKIASFGFASAPASAFSLGSGFKLFSDGGKVGKANAPIERNIISAFNRERSMSGGRRPRLIVANEDELILTPKETQAYLEYKNNAPIKNYANGGFVGGKPSYSTASNNNNSNQSLVINNTSNVTVESRNDMGYSINQLKERENTQNERTRKRFFG